MVETLVPAREGRALAVANGGRIRVTTPRGRQAADFFAFNARNVGEWLSPPHSWVANFSVKPVVGADCEVTICLGIATRTPP